MFTNFKVICQLNMKPKDQALEPRDISGSIANWI